jgi:DNA-binding transcriptional LysR family regulator
MNLNRISLFCVVARQLNLTKASQILHVSQPSLSHQMSVLQSDYHVRLYKKTGHGIELTADGRKFLNEAEAILERVERLERQFSARTKNDQPESLNVGASYGLSVGFLPSLLADFQRDHPWVQTALRTGTRTMVEQLVLRGEVDIALMQIAGSLSSLVVSEPFGIQKLVAFVSVEHPLARKPKVTVRELLETPLVISGEPVFESNIKTILRALEDKGYKPRIAGFYDSPDALKVAVLKKAGVGLFYCKDVVNHEVQKGELKVLNVQDLKLYGRTFIMYHKIRPLSANAKLFLELLRQQKGKQQRNV